MKPFLRLILFVFFSTCFIARFSFAGTFEQPSPKETVKLVFIHHSCGENWLADNHGKLGRELGKNNYYVSDTNYGWGPNDIGDRTDIINWPEWFTGNKSKKYLKALYRLSSKNSLYSRSLKNPGGENRIIMFKSCFPNSELEGKPSDPPKRGDDLTVSNAKAIYIDILKYFATRPDKLFVAITAPPVLDKSLSANARAFNNWLVHHWLTNYKGTNVAVFDFFNILTGPNNHHRLINGKIEHVYEKRRNTLYYPTGDDEHPSPKGNLKATREFNPLLNAYYNKWKSGQRFTKPVAQIIKDEADTDNEPIAGQDTPVCTVKAQKRVSIKPTGATIDDFENNSFEWVVFSDEENSKTHLVCGIKKAIFFKGEAGLEIDYNVAHDSWATCSLVYPESQDWTKKKGISLFLRAERTHQEVTIVVYQGDSPDDLHHFEYYVETEKNAVKRWHRINITWDMLVQPKWDGDGTAKFNPGKAIGVAFAFDESKGKIWIDNISFLPEELDNRK